MFLGENNISSDATSRKGIISYVKHECHSWIEYRTLFNQGLVLVGSIQARAHGFKATFHFCLRNPFVKLFLTGVQST